jgi:hypothetical protein
LSASVPGREPVHGRTAGRKRPFRRGRRGEAEAAGRGVPDSGGPQGGEAGMSL